MVQALFIGLRRGAGLEVFMCMAPRCFTWNGISENLPDMITKKKAGKLPMRLDLMSHAPTGFECGYLGSGPAQLALAICAAMWGDARAREIHQLVKERAIAGLPNDRHWCLTEMDVRLAVYGLAA